MKTLKKKSESYSKIEITDFALRKAYAYEQSGCSCNCTCNCQCYPTPTNDIDYFDWLGNDGTGDQEVYNG